MIVELISIGDELLKGSIVNTNLAFISRHLRLAGYPVARHTVLPDENKALSAGFQEALQRADLIISTGGLGPTLDDRTRVVAAELFDCDFHFDQTVAEDIKRRFANVRVDVENQATIPSKAKPLLNRIGTAPGLVFSERGKTLSFSCPASPKKWSRCSSTRSCLSFSRSFP